MSRAETMIDREAVLAFIYDPKNRRRIIWSPGTTLAAMGIEHYPHDPPTKLRQMRRVLEALHDDGHLVRRERLHSNYTLKEVAYERVGEDHSRVGPAAETPESDPVP